MPPVFGILNTHLESVNPEMTHRMKRAAIYVKSRKLEIREFEFGFAAASVVEDNPLKEETHTVETQEEWMIIADTSLYNRENKETDSTDTGYILNCWIKFGRECVKHLYGDFTFIIFNNKTGEIFCARDHLGVRPLFYAFVNNTFIFASELRLVLAAMPEKQQVRQDYLLDTLVASKSVKSRTSFVNILKLPPAHFLHFSGDRTLSEEYWRLDPAKRILLSSEREYIDLLREKLVNAVEIRSREANTATELSGGLDSSAITGIAADFREKEGTVLSAYSNVFPQGTRLDFKDEREYINEMAGFTSFKWTGIDRLNKGIPELLQHAIRFQGCYIQQNFSIHNSALYETAGKDNIHVLLSGFGGDEMISARTAVQWNELIKEKQWRGIIDELYYKGITFNSLLKPVLIMAGYLKSKIEPMGYASGVFTRELLDGRFANIPLQHDFAKAHELRKRLTDNFRKLKRDKLSWRQFDRIMMDHLPQRLEYCYAAAAQYGIEYRYPLLDVDLIETALAFPPWLKQHHGINRYMFREAIKGFVPEEIRLRNAKSGSTIPQTYYSLVTEKEEILALIREASTSPSLNKIFDFSKFPGWYEKLVKRDPKEMNYLMPGAFYSYLMILLYYKDREDELKELLEGMK